MNSEWTTNEYVHDPVVKGKKPYIGDWILLKCSGATLDKGSRIGQPANVWMLRVV